MIPFLQISLAHACPIHPIISIGVRSSHLVPSMYLYYIHYRLTNQKSRRNRFPSKTALPFSDVLCQVLGQIHSFQLTLSQRRRAPLASQACAIGGDFDLRALDEAEHRLEVAGHVRDCAFGGLGVLCVAV